MLSALNVLSVLQQLLMRERGEIEEGLETVLTTQPL